MITRINRLAAHYEATRKLAEKKRDGLAELVADGWTIKDAAARLGIGPTAATKHWRRIREGLGWQAV